MSYKLTFTDVHETIPDDAVIRPVATEIYETIKANQSKLKVDYRKNDIIFNGMGVHDLVFLLFISYTV